MQEIEQAYRRLSGLEADLDAARAELGNRDVRLAQTRDRIAELEAKVADYEDQIVRAFQRIRADDKTTEKTRRALSVALALLDERANAPAPAPRPQRRVRAQDVSRRSAVAVVPCRDGDPHRGRPDCRARAGLPGQHASGPRRGDCSARRGLPGLAGAGVLRNRQLEVVVVPAIGRIVALRLLRDGAAAADPLWLHPKLGRELAPDDNGWINFGGDKAWPAPQSDWSRIAGRPWPPPVTFDARAYTAEVVGESIVRMTSQVDPAYGMRVRRDIRLAGDEMIVETTYEKLAGPAVRAAVWTITQLTSPERIFLLLPERSSFAAGHRSVGQAPPSDVSVDGRLLSLARDRKQKTMLVSDAEALAWIGPGCDLLLRTASPPPAAGAVWPDGARAQVYTSPDGDQPYVELELLGTLQELAPGQRAVLQVSYRLFPRALADPLAEARRIMAMH